MEQEIKLLKLVVEQQAQLIEMLLSNMEALNRTVEILEMKVFNEDK